jgi:hypothetical protein
MRGVILGYVVSHPSLPRDLTVNSENQNLPILAFRFGFVLTRADGLVGAEDMRGRGILRMFYDPNGFTDEIVNNPESVLVANEIERDDVYFEGMLDFSDHRYYLRMHETSVASNPFSFARAEYRTPVGRVALNIMVGEYNGESYGMAIASSGTMPYLTPTAKLATVIGPLRY